MDTKDKKIYAGVYALICLWSGSAYVGASHNLKKRFQRHLDLLRLDRHPCNSLQEEWKEFGPDCFALFPLEFVEDKLMRCARERAWTKRCLRDGKVYNEHNAVTEQHRSEFKKCKPKWLDEPIGSAAREYHFLTPLGNSMKVRGLKGICEAYGLNISHMSKVARGVYVQHRGWTLGKQADEVFKN